MSRQDDIATIERNLRLTPNRHAPTCACVVRHVGGVSLYPIYATCDCGQAALNRLIAGTYASTEETA